MGAVVAVDESVHEACGTYVVAAVRCASGDVADVAERLRAVVPNRGRPHWHRESERVRRALADAAAPLCAWARAYVVPFDRPRRQTAARVRALVWLAAELPADVTELCLDAREARQDARDRVVLGRSLRPGVRYRHVRGSDEPLVWLADVVAGAVAAAHLGRAAYPALAEVVTVRRA